MFRPGLFQRFRPGELAARVWHRLVAKAELMPAAPNGFYSLAGGRLRNVFIRRDVAGPKVRIRRIWRGGVSHLLPVGVPLRAYGGRANL
jgi:hypothetical protein